MLRKVLGILSGFALFMVLITVSAPLVAVIWPEMAAVEAPTDYSLPMLLTRLTIGAIATVAGGLVTGLISSKGAQGGLILGIVFLVFFIPMHISIWDDFPPWYHITFIASLVPLAWLGGKLAPRKG